MLKALKQLSCLTFFMLPYANSAPASLQITTATETVETVFDWSNDRCFDENIPDSPARAFRANDGSVHLYASHYKNTPLKGPSLDNVKPACNTLFSAPFNANPMLYDTRIWLQTFYSTNKGQKIYSLGSSDYHGKWFNNCKKNTHHDCWMSAIVLAISDDGGKNFKTPPPPNHIIARSPAKFSNARKGAVGFLTTSNIVKNGDYYYSLFYATPYKEQQAGNCLARSNNLENPKSWLAWNGSEFSDPLYPKSDQDSDGRICKTLSSLPYKVRSLMWNPASKQYIATFERLEHVRVPARIDVQFSFALSKNLKDWSKPENIMTLKGREHCHKPQASGAYPSIIDSTSADENFGTTNSTPHLYFTRFNLTSNCQLTLDRDLVRIPLKILPK